MSFLGVPYSYMACIPCPSLQYVMCWQYDLFFQDAREWCDRWQSVGWAIGSLCAGAGVVGGIAARYIRHDVEAYVDGKIAQVVSKNDEFRVAATKTHYDFQQKISDLFLEYQRELNMLAKSHLQFQRDMMKLEHSIFLLPNVSNFYCYFYISFY
jgi:hypothetical protein